MTESPRIMTRSGSDGVGCGREPDRLLAGVAARPRHGWPATDAEVRGAHHSGGIRHGGDRGHHDEDRTEHTGHWRAPPAHGPPVGGPGEWVARRGSSWPSATASVTAIRRRSSGHVGEPCARAVEVDDDRPVPQVDAVGDGPDEVQRPPGEARGRTGPARSGGRRRRRARPARRRARKPPSNMKVFGSPPGVPALTQNTARAAAASGPITCRLRRARCSVAARRGEEGQGGARHQVEEPGVGAVVDPRGVDARVEQDGHEDRREQTERDREDHSGACASHVERSGGGGAARGARPGRTAPRSPATTCAAAARAWRTARSTTGGRRSGASCWRTARSRWRRPAGPDRSTRPLAPGPPKMALRIR